ncbi:MAG: PDZ domain-containing protein [Terriglobia bacterium]
MNPWKIRVSLGVFVLLAVAGNVWAQCYTLGADKNGPCGDSLCDAICAFGGGGGYAPLPPWNVFPGFIPEQVGQRLVVAGILPNSPAAEAGLQLGDQLLAVDGIALPLLGSESYRWQRPGPHRLRVKRGKQHLNVEITPVPAHVLLASAAPGQDIMQPTNLRMSQEPRFPRSPYLSGLIVRKDDQHAVVVDVLPGTAAEAAGIKVGDEIIDAASELVAAENGKCLADLQGSDYRALVELTVQRAGQERVFKFRMSSLTEIFHNLTVQSSVPTHHVQADF